MSDEVYGELFALGQFMPGPTSTQVSFAIGIVKKGIKGEPCLSVGLAPPLHV
jgi:chromate transporter